MSRTYKATGVNLKSMPLGESDRLLTILTSEQGLIRVVAPGCRKPNSKLGGRSGLFVVNELLIAKGRSLDKISQAETLASYPGLGRTLAKLTASQYLAELVLGIALSDQPQTELLWLLCEHLTRLEQALPTEVLACLAQAIFHLLAWAGIAPQVQACCLTQIPVVPDFTTPNWRVEFSAVAGGVVSSAPLVSQLSNPTQDRPSRPRVAEAPSPSYSNTYGSGRGGATVSSMRLNAIELSLLQQLSQPEPLRDCQLPSGDGVGAPMSALQSAWLSVERALRQYAQYYFDRPIRSASLMEACFFPLPSAS